MYRHVLAAIDFDGHAEAVGRRAIALAKAFNARLQVMHVVEYVPIDPTGEGLLPGTLEVSATLREQAERQLAEWCRQHQLDEIPQLLGAGSVDHEILRVARDEGCDLIVIGSHRPHGLKLILGSTEDSVRHKAHCDVLAVHLSDH